MKLDIKTLEEIALTHERHKAEFPEMKRVAHMEIIGRLVAEYRALEVAARALVEKIRAIHEPRIPWHFQDELSALEAALGKETT